MADGEKVDLTVAYGSIACEMRAVVRAIELAIARVFRRLPCDLFGMIWLMRSELSSMAKRYASQSSPMHDTRLDHGISIA